MCIEKKEEKFDCRFTLGGSLILSAKDEKEVKALFFKWFNEHSKGLINVNNEILKKINWNEKREDILYDIYNYDE